MPRTTLRLDEIDHADIGRIAKAVGKSKSAVFREAVAFYLKEFRRPKIAEEIKDLIMGVKVQRVSDGIYELQSMPEKVSR